MAFPDIPNVHALAVLLLTVLALFLFTREKIPLESSSLFILVTLIIGFELFPFKGHFGEVQLADFFHGFGHEALIAVCSLMVAGQALVRTGALEPVARRLGRFWKKSPVFALLATLVVGAILSAFMNNTPIVVLMLPMLIGAAARSKTSASGVLLPMGLATLVGGMGTTIGTSTNLLVVSVAADMGMVRFQMFDFMLPVVVAGGIGLLYLWLIAPRIIPERHPPMTDVSHRVFEAQLAIPKNSRHVGHKLAKLLRKVGPELHVRRILRGQNLYITPLPDVRVHAGDKLLVSDTISQLREFQALLGAKLHAETDLASRGKRDNLQLAEVAVTLGSRLHSMKIGDVQLEEQYGLQILALHNASGVLEYRSPGLNEHNLQASDVLLVQGSAEGISRLKMSGEMLVLDGTTDLPRTRKAPLALLIMVLIVALPAFGTERTNCFDYRCIPGPGFSSDENRRCGLAGAGISVFGLRCTSLADPGQSDVVDGDPDQYYLEQRGGCYWYADRDQYRDGTRFAPGTLCVVCPVRCKLEFRDANVLQDQPACNECGWLQIHGLC